MNKVTEQKMNKDKTNLFMDKLRQRFINDQSNKTPTIDFDKNTSDLLMPKPNEKTRNYAYSTRNRSI